MALIKQTIDVPFGLGIDTRTDEKNVLPGKLITLENAVFDKIGRVAKRPGLAALTPTPAGLTVPTDGTIYGSDAELTVRESEYDDVSPEARAQARTIKTNGMQNYIPTAEIFSRLEADIIATPFSSSAVVDGILDSVGRRVGLASSMAAGGGSVTLSIFDYNTKRQILTENGYTNAGLTFLNARVLQSGTADEFIVGTYASTGSELRIHGKVKIGLDPNFLGIIAGNGATRWGDSVAPVPDVSLAGIGAVGMWDWVLSGNNLFLIYLDAGAANITVAKYNITTWAAPTTATFAAAGVTALAIGIDALGTTLGILWSTAAAINYRGYNPATMALVTGTTASVNVAATYELLALVGNATSTGFRFAYQVSAAPAQTYNRAATSGTLTTVGVASLNNTRRGTGLASKPGAYSGTFAATYDTALQRSLFFFKTGNTLPQGRTLYTRHGGLIGGRCLPNGQDIKVSATNNENAYDFFTTQMCSQEATATAIATANVYAPAWVQAQQPGGLCAIGGARPFPSMKVQGRTIFGGGFLHRITGENVELVGFPLYPEIVSVTPAAAGGSLADGAYGVITTYEVVDSEGNVFESDSSPPVFGTVSGGGGAGQLTVVVQNYRIDLSRADVYVVFYRTLNGGTTYYRERRVLMDPNVISTSQVLTAASATLSAAAILYTLGEQGNTQPDGPSAMCADQDRVWVTPGSARNRVLPSKPIVGGVGLSFFPDVFRQVAANGDAVTNLERLDGRLFAFKSGTTSVASGSGPDATGNSDDLSEFSELFPNIGAEGPVSVVKGPVGLYVKSATDIWFIGRDMQPIRVGADVEAYSATQVLRAAAYITKQRQVRFLYGREAQPNFELVFDEESRQWSYNTRQQGVDWALPSLAYFNEMPHYMMPLATGGGGLFKEDGTVYDDNGAPYLFKLVTAWLKPAQVLQGFARIYRALLLGDNLASHTLQVRVRYDYQNAWVETHTISSANATVGGTAWQPEIRFQRQKCEAFALEISDGFTGQAFNLSGLELLVGIKPGTYRTRAAKRF